MCISVSSFLSDMLTNGNTIENGWRAKVFNSIKYSKSQQTLQDIKHCVRMKSSGIRSILTQTAGSFR